jgi:hypothetical protein
VAKFSFCLTQIIDEIHKVSRVKTFPLKQIFRKFVRANICFQMF